MGTRVDFYILPPDGGGQSPEGVACRIAERAWRGGHQVEILARDPVQAQHIDELLWSFRDTAFVPHHVRAAPPPPHGPGGPGLRVVEIRTPASGTNGEPAPGAPGSAPDTPPEGGGDVLINLSGAVPLDFPRYRRVAEIVPGAPEARARGRDRYRRYREEGCELHSHQLGERR